MLVLMLLVLVLVQVIYVCSSVSPVIVCSLVLLVFSFVVLLLLPPLLMLLMGVLLLFLLLLLKSITMRAMIYSRTVVCYNSHSCVVMVPVIMYNWRNAGEFYLFALSNNTHALYR